MSSNHDIATLDKAYERGFNAAASEGQNEDSNPYAYRAETALYWEWMRGFREFKYGKT